MLNFFANPSYQGSTLERLINASPELQLSKENVETFAQALCKEYPRPYDHASTGDQSKKYAR